MNLKRLRVDVKLGAASGIVFMETEDAVKWH